MRHRMFIGQIPTDDLRKQMYSCLTNNIVEKHASSNPDDSLYTQSIVPNEPMCIWSKEERKQITDCVIVAESTHYSSRNDLNRQNANV